MRADDLFSKVTESLIRQIEAGASGWRMPWHHLAEAGTPMSADGRRYRGMNALWLALVAAETECTSGVWATYKAWQRHGAQVRRGERGTSVALWKPVTKRPGRDETDEEAGTAGGQRFLLARTYSVFVAEQVDGAESVVARLSGGRPERDTPERIDSADAYFDAVGARREHGGNRACYQPGTDTIHLPDLAQFVSTPAYYATSAHEHGHWTGHPTRLGRDLSGRFGSNAYAAEELVAEMAAAMWCAQMAITPADRSDDHAAYLASWLDVLRSDARALVTVSSRAQAAVDYLNEAAGYAAEPEGDAD
jgi:antirestriction protein ArdC